MFGDYSRPVVTKSTVSLLAIMVLVLSTLLPSAQQPVIAADSNPAPSMAAVPLNVALVSAPEINKVFDLDGVIVVNDLATSFNPPGATGGGFLQTRLFPRGERGTLAAGLYAYLYRVDLRNSVALTTKTCLSSFTIPFGEVVPLPYTNTKEFFDIFVITQGGLGNLKPSQVSQQDNGDILFEFKDPICPGNKSGGGDSSFFVGLTARYPYRPVDAVATFTVTGTGMNLASRSPLLPDNVACVPLAKPGEVPSPALINFDRLINDKQITTTYQPTYGITFDEPVYSLTLDKLLPPSDPNVAHAKSSMVANFPLAFSFDQDKPVTHVGFYAGNPSTVDESFLVSVYDAQKTLICQARGTLPALQFNTFIGFYYPHQTIHRVEISYLQTETPEMIDNLIFSPGTGARNEFPRAQDPVENHGPELIVRSSDNKRLELTFNLPDPNLWLEEGGGKLFTRFNLPGVEINAGADGAPDIPLVRRLVAVPEGAEASIQSFSIAASDQFLAELYPSQPPAVDQNNDEPPDASRWEDPPFVLDTNYYETPGDYPTEPVGLYPVGKMRDLNLALLVVAGGQYDPVTKRLTIFKSVDLEIQFQGGTGYFLPDYSNNLFEPSISKLYPSVVNSMSIGSYVDPSIVNAVCLGHEYIIITHPNFQTAAQTLANWKNSKGISTLVEPTSSTMSTPAQIKAFVKQKYDNCLVRPAYLLLFGDAEFIGAFQYADTYSDLDYALMTSDDIFPFPDLAFGRIPVDTLAQANTVVSKIIAYEKTPPVLPAFYKNMAIASFFQCCSQTISGKAYDERSFIETSERARAALVAAGKTFTRIYTTDVNMTSVKPAYYRSGALLPTAIGYNSGYPWNGGTTNIINAINNGTGLIMHRGHGWPGGWADPGFSSNNLSSLTNGNLTPVLYSVNCSSGVWDNELSPGDHGLSSSYISWSERILRMEGGAVGVIGDMRDSPTWANSALARGLYDATWPATDTTYGGSTVHRRLGDVLNYAKLYMFVQVFLPQTAGSVSFDQYRFNNRIYHVIGDPTLEIWTSNPNEFVLPSNVKYKWVPVPLNAQQQADQMLVAEYPVEGAEITLLQEGEPVGRGVVVGGEAIIKFVADIDPTKALTASASYEDAVSVSIGQWVFLPAIMR